MAGDNNNSNTNTSGGTHGTGGSNSGSNDNNNTSGGRRNQKNNRFHRKKDKKPTVKSDSTKFEGKCTDLKGYVFDCSGPSQADKYVVTKREIEEYVGRTYKHGTYTKTTLEEGREITLPEPDDPPIGATETKKLIWKKTVEAYIVKCEQLKENLKQAYELVWGQCTELMRAKLEALKVYKQLKKDYDVLGLLREIKGIAFKFEDQRYVPHSLHNAYKNFYNLRQKPEETNTQYLEHFQNQIDVIEQYGGSLGKDKALIDLLDNDDDNDESVISEYDDAEEDVEEEDPNLNVDAMTEEQLKARVKILQDRLDKERELRLDKERKLRDTKAKQNDTAAERDADFLEKTRRSRDIYLAYSFIFKSDNDRYSKLKEELSNDYAKGRDNYPKNVTGAFKLLSNYRLQPKKSTGSTSTGVNFATRGEKNNLRGRNNTNNNSSNKIKCYACGKEGHIARDCPNNTSNNNGNHRTGTSNAQVEQTNNNNSTGENQNGGGAQVGASFFQYCKPVGTNMFNADLTHIEEGVTLYNGDDEMSRLRDWILLDNQSTTDIFCNNRLLTNIRNTNDIMTITTNAGSFSTRQKGTLGKYGDVWYSPKAITNVLSLRNVKNEYRVTYDSTGSGDFEVHKPDGQIRFVESSTGLYIHDTTKKELVLVNTVAEKRKGYSEREYRRAEYARRVYEMLGFPSQNDFRAMVQGSTIGNNDITERDIFVADDIFGWSARALKGKSVRETPDPVVSDYVHPPTDILQKYKNVELCVDIMFINKIPFLVTISKHIKFTTVEMLDNRKMASIVKGIKTVVNIYNKRGFNVHVCYMDGEFDPIRRELGDTKFLINTTSANEHVPEVERQIRVIKERVRAVRSSLPYKVLPIVMVECMACYAVMWINSFPPKGGVSSTASPRMIVIGTKLDVKLHCRIPFGAYAQVTEENTVTNSMNPRTIGAIALGPTGNLQGGVRFLNLNTGRLIVRRSFKEIPVPQEVIQRVENIAVKQDQKSDLSVTNRKGIEIAGVHVLEDEDDEIPAEDDNESAVEDRSATDDDVSTPDDEPIIFDESDDIDDMIEEVDGNYDDETVDDVIKTEEPPNSLARDIQPETVEVETVPEDTVAVEPVPVSEPYTTRSGRVSRPPSRLQPNMTGKSYSNFIASSENTLEYSSFMDGAVFKIMNHYALQQYGLDKGIKVWGDRGKIAAYKEVEQLHMREAFKPVDTSNLSTDERKKAIGSLIFLKEKTDGTIKGRACADGRKQREDAQKGESSSPTVSLESVLLTALVDAHENRDVAIMDIPNAFIQTDMEGEKVVMKLRGNLAELLVQVAPELYSKYVTMENGKVVLYVELVKALYGCLQSALLFYKKLLRDLLSQGFVLNPYDPCVVNKNVDGKIHTVVWHVDDLKASHVNPKVNDEFIDWVKATYANDGVGKVKTSRGTKHEYLGMELDFSEPGSVRINMENYIERMLDSFTPGVVGKSATPAAIWLFNTRDEAGKLSTDKSAMFHTMVAKGLFASKRARPDIQLAIAFLSTRVREPDDDDWKKLIKLLKYLNGTRRLGLKLSADSTSILKWYVDASFAVHPDCKGHTGGVLTLGKGAAYSTSTKQKLNAKSSTESELIGVDDVLPQVLWTNYFMKAQGINVTNTILYQDNKSTILLANNGKTSSSKRTKHINVRYFFVTDRIQRKELEIEYCPTDDMISDYFTKPLHGSKFLRLRKLIMNDE